MVCTCLCKTAHISMNLLNTSLLASDDPFPRLLRTHAGFLSCDISASSPAPVHCVSHSDTAPGQSSRQARPPPPICKLLHCRAPFDIRSYGTSPRESHAHCSDLRMTNALGLSNSRLQLRDRPSLPEGFPIVPAVHGPYGHSYALRPTGEHMSTRSHGARLRDCLMISVRPASNHAAVCPDGGARGLARASSVLPRPWSIYSS